MRPGNDPPDGGPDAEPHADRETHVSLPTPLLSRRRMTRRTVLAGAAAALASGALPGVPWVHGARAQGTPPGGGMRRSHGLSSFGELALPADYAQFPHVNPAAPKGGTLSYQPPTRLFNQSFDTFNTLNGYVLQGEAPPRVELTFDSLMIGTGDEPDAMYGLLADWVDIAEDGLTYEFRLRPQARFHDGTPVTAADVAWSLSTLKAQGHPNVANLLAEMEGAEAVEEHLLRVTLAPGRPRDLHLSVAGLPVFSRASWEGRDFAASTLEPVLGSGPYRVGDFEAGRFVHFDRVEDWWAADLPCSIGQHNFGRIRVNFFRDRDVAFEAFKAGDMNWREEFTSRVWASEYTFPAVASGAVVREELPDGRPSGAQGFYFNTRRAKFADPRVREALGLLFDFEWSNERLFFGLYARTHSMFENAPFKAEGLPSPQELALLEPFRAELPEAVFGEPYVPPVSDGSGADRTLQRQADRMLAEAGWRLEGGRRVNAAGEAMSIEFLIVGPTFERIINPYIQNLQRLGIDASLRTVDGAQYQTRLNAFDFDIVSSRMSFSLTPGTGLRTVFGSRFANEPGSWNLAGIAVPALDALIEQAGQATSRDGLYVVMRAIDRVLRAGHYWVPQWFKPTHWVAHAATVRRPASKPRYALPVESHWWMES